MYWDLVVCHAPSHVQSTLKAVSTQSLTAMLAQSHQQHRMAHELCCHLLGCMWGRCGGCKCTCQLLLPGGACSALDRAPYWCHLTTNFGGSFAHLVSAGLRTECSLDAAVSRLVHSLQLALDVHSLARACRHQPHHGQRLERCPKFHTCALFSPGSAGATGRGYTLRRTAGIWHWQLDSFATGCRNVLDNDWAMSPSHLWGLQTRRACRASPAAA